MQLTVSIIGTDATKTNQQNGEVDWILSNLTEADFCGTPDDDPPDVDDDLTLQEQEEIPHDETFAGTFSAFFLETFAEAFPETYAQELFNFFHYVAHPYRRCWDKPEKSPRNEEIETAIKNKGKKGSHTFPREGFKFILRPLGAWMFAPKHEYKKHYYTSDRRLAMPYLDVDCHKAYQTPAMGKAARKLIESEFQARLGIIPAFVGSSGGENGYLKVKMGQATPEEANRVFDDLQDAIRLLFIKHGNLADFETKGTITWMDEDGTLKAGRYGKLPMCSPDWSYGWFESFRGTRSVTLGELEQFCAAIKAQVTEEDVRHHEEARHQAVLAHYLPEQRWKLNRDIGNAWEDECISHRGEQWISKKLVPESLIKKLWPDYRIVRHEQEAICTVDAGIRRMSRKRASLNPTNQLLRQG